MQSKVGLTIIATIPSGQVRVEGVVPLGRSSVEDVVGVGSHCWLIAQLHQIQDTTRDLKRSHTPRIKLQQ